MFSHIMVGTNDLDRAKTFYDAVMGALGLPAGRLDRHRVFYMTPTGVFAVSLPIDGPTRDDRQWGRRDRVSPALRPIRPTRGTPQGSANGGVAFIEDPPGVREGPTGKLYLAYLRDPDGNKVCGLHRMG